MRRSPIKFELLPAFLALLLLFGTTGTYAKPTFEFGAPAPAVVKAPLQKLSFNIKNPSCASCVATFVQALSLTGGVRYARVELHAPGDADSLVVYDARVLKREQIVEMLHRFHFMESNVRER